jgi:hypothetical protein
MGIRRHLTYANVTATLALVLALGAGGAYAVDLIGSGDVRNDSLLSKDLRDKRAVGGRDVQKDSLGGREIDEHDLAASRLLNVKGDAGPTCALDVAAYTDCASATVRLPKHGKIHATAAGAFFGDDSGQTNARCEIRLDEAPSSVGISPGEVSGATSATATQGFARTVVFEAVAAGSHDVALACEELLGEASIASPTITAIAITGR